MKWKQEKWCNDLIIDDGYARSKLDGMGKNVKLSILFLFYECVQRKTDYTNRNRIIYDKYLVNYEYFPNEYSYRFKAAIHDLDNKGFRGVYIELFCPR